MIQEFALIIFSVTVVVAVALIWLFMKAASTSTSASVNANETRVERNERPSDNFVSEPSYIKVVSSAEHDFTQVYVGPGAAPRSDVLSNLNRLATKAVESKEWSAAADLHRKVKQVAELDGVFCSSMQAYREVHLNKAYWEVMNELTGHGITPEIFQVIQPAFIAALGDSRSAGSILVDALSGIDWDWPRWHGFAKRNDYSKVSDFALAVQPNSLPELLDKSSKADLVALGMSLKIAIPKSIKKTEIISRLLVLPAGLFDTWAHATNASRQAKDLKKLHRDMGRFVASRIGALAREALQYEQRSDAEVLSLHPYWRFICPTDGPTPAPKRCSDLDKKVLPASEAMKRFPKLPCDRLDCQCRVTTQSTSTLQVS